MSNYYIKPYEDYPDSLMHEGTKGMRWGFRRYQNEDGSLTPEGRIHYGVGQGRKHASLAEDIHKYRVKKKRSKALEKARKTKAKNAAEKKKQAEKDEKRKAKMKKNYVRDDARKTYQNLDNMSDDEVKAAMARLNNESKIREYAMAEIDQEKKANPSKYEKALDYINKAVTISKNVSDIANNISNTKSYMDKMFGNSSGNNNNQNNNQNNQNNGGGKKKNKGIDALNSILNNNQSKNQNNNQQSNKQNQNGNGNNNQNSKQNLMPNEKALADYRASRKDILAGRTLASEKAADEAADKRYELDNMLKKNQERHNSTEQMLRDNQAARGAARAYENWYNSNYTASTNPNITQQTFSTSLTDAFDLEKINHGKDILVAMGLD